ncbi:MAG: PIN domain-containing protein [Egibacteraceae bacterium]
MTTTSFASHSSRSIPGPSSFPARVLAEVCWLLESRIGPDAEAAFLDSVAGGELELAELSNDDVRRMAALVRRYRGFPLGAVDAAVIAIAERLETIEIATLDHRHFRAVKPVHADAFELLP